MTNSQISSVIAQVLELSRQMLILADEGEAHCENDTDALFCGIVRDSAFRLRAEAMRLQGAERPQGERVGEAQPPEVQ